MREAISPELRKRVLERDKYQCRYCGTKQEPFHLDHVYPVVKGGETTFNNLVTACVRCNSTKHSSVGMWPKSVGYFDPKPKEVHISILTVLLFSLGIGLIGSGFMNIHISWEFSKWAMFIGFIVCNIGLAKLVTGG